MRSRAVCIAVLAVAACACSSRSKQAPPDPPSALPKEAAVAPVPAAAAATPATGADPRRWFAGDVHMHTSPPDDPADVSLSPQKIAVAAREAHMDFVVLAPHLWPNRWRQRATFQREWKALAEAARGQAGATGVTLIPGAEWSTVEGHFTVAGADLVSLEGDNFLAAAHAAGAFISVNHPFAVPTRIPGVPASHFDMGYKVWTAGRPGFTAIDAVEVWNMPLALANIISRPGGRSGEDRAWTEANRVVHAEKRRLAAVGGTDNHRLNVSATTWVLARDASEPAILDALRAGGTCVGGTEAGTLKIRGDDGAWRRVGDSVAAAARVQLAWDGTAHLFIDDVDRGEHAGGFTHETGGALHTYRIVVGNSRCGFVYANLP